VTGRRPTAGGSVVIGIDVGTSSSKGVACLADGTIVATARLEHAVATPHPGWFEHDADGVWWAGLVAICQALRADLGRKVSVAAVAVTTCGPCLVPVDHAGRPLRPGILYGVDTRARAEMAAFEMAVGDRAIRRLSRMPLTSQSVGPKIAWVVHNEPDVARRTATWHTATSYLVARLTGTAAIDHHQASYFGPFVDARRRAWDDRYGAGLDLPGRLPPVRWASEIAGRVTADAAAATGLALGTPVLVGTSDGPMEALAAGATKPGVVAIAYGSTTTLTSVGVRPRRRSRLWQSEGWAVDGPMVGAGLATSGAIVSWLRREFARELPDRTGARGADALGILAAEAEASPAGANGLLALPSFGGALAPFDDPLARGVLVGLTPAHTRADVHRAILEGIAFGVRQILEAFEADGISVDELRAAGGGTLSAAGVQIVSDVTGRAQTIPRDAVGAASGAAFLAARAVGLVPAGDQQPDGWFVPARRIAPEPRHAAIYERRYALFRRLDRDTRAVIHALAAESPVELPA
jgi:xylulokinase